MRNLIAACRSGWRNVSQMRQSTRPWQMPVMAAVVMGIPLAIGAALKDLPLGSTGTLGALAFLYMPSAASPPRATVVSACAVALLVMYAVGLTLSDAGARIPTLGLASILLTSAARAIRLPPPYGLFFLMALSIGLYSNVAVDQVPTHLGAVAFGGACASLASVLYAVLIPPDRPTSSSPMVGDAWQQLCFQPLIIGIGVVISLALATHVGISRPYWAPLSCLTIMNGASLEVIWTRHLQRILGTFLGLGLLSALTYFPFHAISFVFCVAACTFLTEYCIQKNYGIAVIFLTPMAITIAEVSRGHNTISDTIILARLIDTVVGASVGSLCGILMHWVPTRLISSSHIDGNGGNDHGNP